MASSTLLNYGEMKPIEELDPIPSGWKHADRSKFMDHGFLAMSGETPSGVMRTKKVDIKSLLDNLPTVAAWYGYSDSRSTDGTFRLVESRYSESGKADRNLDCTDGQLTALHGGWYAIQATAVLSSSTLRNEYRDIALPLSIATTGVDILHERMDMSLSSAISAVWSTVVYIVDDNSSIKFNVSGMGTDSLISAYLSSVSVSKLSLV